ncbi:hypothetical protein HPB52_024547 [Rhipicephalus sanguineus]|uniref:Uncharacterized protein n=1 Tax=Rhipicephalus sanguineus TaxID=34632 RepID=A0A9D4YS15_RHISA|nr:hypothetical protein HPB52_024547 [Rhipicephalus sanguineus]
MDEDIIRVATHTDQATGRVKTVPLAHVRLRPDAVPSKLPNCPSYMSRKTARREDPDSKRARIENAALQKAIAESNEAFIRAREEDKVNSLSELANHLRSQGMKFWDVIERNERLLLIHIVDDEAPLTCKFKEVAHIVPVHRVEAEFLQKTLKEVVCGLEKIGYRVMCVVRDNSVNRKAMSSSNHLLVTELCTNIHQTLQGRCSSL